MSFFDNIKQNANRFGKTANNAKTLDSTLNANLDFFGKSLRNESEEKIKTLFIEAIKEDSILALKNYFHNLDIRNGKGERKVSYILSSRIMKKYNFSEQEKVTFLNYVAKLGRWDYILWFYKHWKNEVVQVITTEMQKEASLLAKWLPTIKSIPKPKEKEGENGEIITIPIKQREFIIEKQKIARGIAKALFPNLNPKQAYNTYNKQLQQWRKTIYLVETDMSKQNWNQIPYEKVPSKANLRYSAAFYRHDKERRDEFIKNVNEGKTKLNQSVSNPFELISKFNVLNDWRVNKDDKNHFNAYWKNLKEINLPKENVLVVCDTSASMTSDNHKPMNNSVGLGLYIAERNHGIFKDKVISFSGRPEYIDLSTYSTSFDKAKAICTREIANTNILATMKLIGKSIYQLSAEERIKQAPKYLVILTDMQFDSGTYGYDQTIHEEIERMFKQLQVEMPQIIYWNLSSHNNMPVEYNKQGVAIISGYSQNILDNLFSLDKIEIMTPEKIMLKTLSKYDNIIVNLNYVV